MELNRDEVDQLVKSVYHNWPIETGRYKSPAVDLTQLPSDLTVECIDGEIETSAMVISARSEYFRTMLSGRWRESSENRVKLDFGIQICDQFRTLFEPFLIFELFEQFEFLTKFTVRTISLFEQFVPQNWT